MIILNDIEFLIPLRTLGLMQNGLFGISQFYLSENYIEVNEKIAIKELESQGRLTIFELSNDFYKYYNYHCIENPEIAITDLSSVYYAEKYNLKVLSRCEHVKKFAIENNVIICDPIEALKMVNAEPQQISILEYIMNNIIKN